MQILNWFPISDWDKGFGQVDFTVDGLDASQGELYAHAGYFGKDPQVRRTSTGYQVHVDNLPASGKLELHAYWPMTSALRENNQAYLLNKTNKADFLKKEADIKKSKEQFQTSILCHLTTCDLKLCSCWYFMLPHCYL